MLVEETVRNVSQQLKEPSWLLDKRMSAFKKFSSLELPLFKYGMDIFTQVKDLNFDLLDPLEDLDNNIITHDEEIEVLPLKTALEKYPLIQKHFEKSISKENKFSALHQAFFNNAILIRIPENVEAKQPIRMNLDLISKTRIEYVFVLAEKNSNAVIIESCSSQNKHAFRSQIIDVIVKENAKLEFRSFQNFGKETHNFSQRVATVEKDATMNWVDCVFGSKFTQMSTKTVLEGKNAETKNTCGIYGDGEQCYDINAESVHNAPHSKSDMKTKTVLNDKAKTVYRGLVKIAPHASGCEGFQKEDALLLSEEAHADAVPNLEIENNDVKCSHGVTMSQIDQDKLFYMMSRGLSKEAVKRAVVEGFFDPVIKLMDEKMLQNTIYEQLSKRLNKKIFNPETIRKDFTVLQKPVKGKPLAYFDNAATSLTPDPVLKKITEYYENYNANVHRGIHTMSELATEEFEEARKKVATFINANQEEIIFTSGTTESLNMLARSLGKDLKAGDEIVLSKMEHHSNIVPWQQLAKDKGLTLKYIELTSEGNLDLENAKELITSNTKIVSVIHMSNVLGTVNNIKELANIAHEKNAVLIVDAAQSVPHLPTDVKELDCDFLAFSGHKMCGPTGSGVLYGKKEVLQHMQPSNFGGGMISEVKRDTSSWADLPTRFEAGTPNITAAMGLGAAIDYLESIGMDNIASYEKELTAYAVNELEKVEGITIHGPNNKASVISFNIEGIHPHDVATILDRDGVAIRAGHLCAMPLVRETLKQNAVCRASLSFYNTKEEIDTMIQAIHKAKQMFTK